ncbi:MAG TPA: hypothetical protein PLX58_08265 [Smithellaceae bacterium]|jgi:hypothetical protein|nr:hypothetical protein [Smithellaceae bacterium]HQF84952.1 hypothetical protein [Smithellaceae bacterium]HQG79494.1 hypothetical protein [Smithellaceae bacterium]
MTITAYQVDNVLNAYIRQSRVKVQTPVLREGENRIDSKDIVTLSTKESNKAGELEKISYNLRDVILKGENQ